MKTDICMSIDFFMLCFCTGAKDKTPCFALYSGAHSAGETTDCK